MQNLRNVHRVLERWNDGRALVHPSSVQGVLNGLLGEFIDAYGAFWLIPQRKNPMTNEIIHQLLNMPADFSLSTDAQKWKRGTGRAVRAAFALLADTGMRNAEATDGGQGPTMTLQHVAYQVDGVLHTNPPPAMNASSWVLVTPGQAKNDPWLRNFSGEAIWLPYDASPRSSARLIYEMDRARNVTGDARKSAPLFAFSDGSPMTSTWLSRTLSRMLCHFMPKSQAAQYSVHSFRIYVATALEEVWEPPTLGQNRRLRSREAPTGHGGAAAWQQPCLRATHLVAKL